MTSIPEADDEGAWVAEDVDSGAPNPARMYDYFLGGAHNFRADRDLAQQALAAMPWMREAVRANRGFLRRAVSYCAVRGVRRYLDLGAGIPTAVAVHEVAQAYDPAAEVIYVDDAPVAASHAQLPLESVPHTRVVRADLTAPGDVLAHPEVAGVLDRSQPVAVLALAVLHSVADDDVAGSILCEYRAAMAPGSVLVFSHVTADHDPDEAAQAVSVYRRSANPVYTRSRAQLQEMLADFEIVEPGIVDASAWRPGGAAHGEHPGFYAAVALRSRRRRERRAGSERRSRCFS